MKIKTKHSDKVDKILLTGNGIYIGALPKLELKKHQINKRIRKYSKAFLRVINNMKLNFLHNLQNSASLLDRYTVWNWMQAIIGEAYGDDPNNKQTASSKIFLKHLETLLTTLSKIDKENYEIIFGEWLQSAGINKNMLINQPSYRNPYTFTSSIINSMVFGEIFEKEKFLNGEQMQKTSYEINCYIDNVFKATKNNRFFQYQFTTNILDFEMLITTSPYFRQLHGSLDLDKIRNIKHKRELGRVNYHHKWKNYSDSQDMIDSIQIYGAEKNILVGSNINQKNDIQSWFIGTSINDMIENSNHFPKNNTNKVLQEELINSYPYWDLLEKSKISKEIHIIGLDIESHKDLFKWLDNEIIIYYYAYTTEDKENIQRIKKTSDLAIKIINILSK